MSEPVTLLEMPMRLDYTITAAGSRAKFLRGLVEGKLLGERCGGCAKVYVPWRGCCPTCGTAESETVELADRGTVTTFCIINIPFGTQAMPTPYAAAAILLDGADLPILHLLNNVPLEQVRMGLRVRAVWDEQPKPTLETIRWFTATGEPDASFDSYKDHQ
jgi:uncharacterized protein